MRATRIRVVGSCALLFVAILWVGCSDDWPLVPSDMAPVAGGPTNAATFAIAPIPGLTTAWHAAPGRTGIPVGVTVKFRCAAPSDAEVTWFGATEVRRDDQWSIAECPVHVAGEQSVRVAVKPTVDDIGGKGGDGNPKTVPRMTHTCVLDAIEIPIEKIRVKTAAVTGSPFHLDDGADNMETMRAFMKRASIAQLRRVSEDHYVTSIRKPIKIAIQVDPPAFAPLMEWRVGGQAMSLGDQYYRMIKEPGTHTFSIGPPSTARSVTFDTYSVTITSHKTGRDFVADNEAVTFTAVTDPPGYEDGVRWLSSTKFGTATPVVGWGSSFDVFFYDTSNRHDRRWLGVRADNAAFAQDQKQCHPSGIDTTSTIPLGPDFQTQLQASALVAAYDSTLDAQGLNLSYAQGREVFYTGFPEADTARFAVIPIDTASMAQTIAGADPFVPHALVYTFDPNTMVEGAEFVAYSPALNTLRMYVSPDLSAYIDLFIRDGCVVGHNAVCPTCSPSDETKQYLQCLAGLLASEGPVIVWLSKACKLACAAGGLGSPACIACIVGAVGLGVADWWICS